MIYKSTLFFFFFFNDTATTEIYTLSLHDALPILKKVVLNAKTPSLFNVLRISAMTCALSGTRWIALRNTTASTEDTMRDTHSALPSMNLTTWEWRSEEHTSELQSQSNLVCRLLLEK